MQIIPEEISKTLDLAKLQPHWDRGDYSQVMRLLPKLSTLPPDVVIPGILLYAKVYWHLAFKTLNSEAGLFLDSVQLAISFALTAVEHWPSADEETKTVFLDLLQAEIEKVRLKLNPRQAEMVSSFFKIEKDAIELLRKMKADGIDGIIQKNLIMTPLVAEKVNLIPVIFNNILKVKTPASEADFAFLGMYSPMVSGFRTLLLGDVKGAFSVTFKNSKPIAVYTGLADGVIQYCKNRILFETALDRLLNADLSGKKYLLSLSDFLNMFQTYVDKLTKTIYSDLSMSQYSVLADALEQLCRKVKSQALHKATAYCISMKIRGMVENGVRNHKQMESLVEVALGLDPECEAVDAMKKFTNIDRYMTQISKSLSKGQYKKAVDLVEDACDDDIEYEFYHCVDSLLSDIEKKRVEFMDDKVHMQIMLQQLENELSRLDSSDEALRHLKHTMALFS